MCEMNRTVRLSDNDMRMLMAINTVGNGMDKLTDLDISDIISDALCIKALTIGIPPKSFGRKLHYSKREELYQKGDLVYTYLTHVSPSQLQTHERYFETLIHINNGNSPAFLRYMKSRNTENAMTAVNKIINDYLSEGGTNE